MAHTLWIVLIILVGFFAVLGFILGLIAYLNEGADDSETTILAPSVQALTQVPALHTSGTFKAGMYFVPSGSYGGNHSPGVLPGQAGVVDLTTNFDLVKSYGHWHLLGEICWIDMGVVFNDRNFDLATLVPTAPALRDETRIRYLSGDLWPEPYFLKSATLRGRAILETGLSVPIRYQPAPPPPPNPVGGQLNARIISDVGEIALYKTMGHRAYVAPPDYIPPYDSDLGRGEYPVFWEELNMVPSLGLVFGAPGTVEFRLEGWYWAKTS